MTLKNKLLRNNISIPLGASSQPIPCNNFCVPRGCGFCRTLHKFTWWKAETDDDITTAWEQSWKARRTSKIKENTKENHKHFHFHTVVLVTFFRLYNSEILKSHFWITDNLLLSNIVSQQTHIPPHGKESSVNCQYIKKIANLFVKTFYFVFAAVFLVLTNAEVKCSRVSHRFATSGVIHTFRKHRSIFLK